MVPKPFTRLTPVAHRGSQAPFWIRVVEKLDFSILIFFENSLIYIPTVIESMINMEKSGKNGEKLLKS